MSPEVSVIVPVYNGARTIGRCLESLLRQELPPGTVEIIVADNGSTDATPRIVADYPVRRLEARPRGRPVARNRGIAAAGAPLLAFIDADDWAAPDWLPRLMAALAAQGLDLVGGDVVPDRAPEEMNLFALHDVLKAFTLEQSFRQAHFLGTGSLLVRRAVFEQIGGFDEALHSSEDYEWGRRAHRAGWRLGFCREAVCRTAPRTTFAAFLEREARIGYGRGQVGRRHGERDQITFHRPGRYLPPLSLLGRRGRERFPFLSGSRRVGLFGLYWLGYFLQEAGNCWGWLRSRRKEA